MSLDISQATALRRRAWHRCASAAECKRESRGAIARARIVRGNGASIPLKKKCSPFDRDRRRASRLSSASREGPSERCALIRFGFSRGL